MVRFALFAAGLLTLPSAALAFADTYAGRLEALTEVQRLQSQLQSRDSATETLRLWCDEHHWAAPAQIRALRDTTTAKPASPQVRALLGAAARTPITYRRVRLMCGERVLSEADNWYLPGKLTAEMNKQLKRTDTPFGVVVRSLNFKRQSVSARILLHPFDEPPVSAPVPAASAGPPLKLPHAVIENSAVLTTPDGAAFSVVIETYTRAALDPAGDLASLPPR